MLIKRLHLFLFLLSVLSASAQNRYELMDSLNPQIGQMLQLQGFPFNLDPSSLRVDGIRRIDTLCLFLSHFKSAQFQLEVHTDCRGSKAYNLEISQRKADTLITYIRRLSNNQINIFGIGKGESELKNNCNCEGKFMALTTQFTEDTINGIPENRFLKNSNDSNARILNPNFVDCSEQEHLRNRRVIIRIIAIKKDE